MSDRFDAYLAVLAARDAALVQLALLALASLIGWLGVRSAFTQHVQDRIIVAGVLVYHLTLLAIIVIGGYR